MPPLRNKAAFIRAEFITNQLRITMPQHAAESGLVSSISSLVFLDPFPLLLATYSDGMMRIWGVKGSILKDSMVLAFLNEAPGDALYWGGEEAEYPLLRCAEAGRWKYRFFLRNI